MSADQIKDGLAIRSGLLADTGGSRKGRPGNGMPQQSASLRVAGIHFLGTCLDQIFYKGRGRQIVKLTERIM